MLDGAMSTSSIPGPSEDFRYLALDTETGEIHLLSIEHDSDGTRPMLVTVEHVQLADDSDFVALSYTWGSESPNHDVHVQGTGSAAGRFTIC